MKILPTFGKRKRNLSKENSHYLKEFNSFYKELGLQFDEYGNPIYTGLLNEAGTLEKKNQK